MFLKLKEKGRPTLAQQLGIKVKPLPDKHIQLPESVRRDFSIPKLTEKPAKSAFPVKGKKYDK